MDITLPDDLALELRVTVPSLSGLTEMILGALAAGEFRDDVERWQLPRDTKSQTGDWRAALDALSTAKAERSLDGRLHLGGGQMVDIATRGTSRTQWRVVMHAAPDKAQPDTYPALLERHTRFCKHWLQAGAVESGLLSWIGGGARCLPIAPIAGDRSHLVVTSHSQVVAAYATPDTFWSAGWAGDEQFGSVHLLSRAMDVTNSTAYLRAVLPHQWAMAHAAKPKQTRYEIPNPLPEEQDIYNEGDQTLHVSGYRAGEQCMEYACYMPAGRHIPGWEILGLYQLLRRGRLPDGLTVANVRVLFEQKEMALRERRTLIDIGAIVAYNAAGRWVDVKE
jgi:hypothetical protein